jgi:preprotein translocase subunit SecA
MDTLKTGIGLRGYNQKDPLTEYKQESFRLFEDLIRKIKTESIQFIHRVDLTQQEEQIAAQKEQEDEYIEDITESNNIAHQEAVEEIQERVAISTKKPKRNDPCPCGSGEKYKNCCGKSGPKKGLLA